MDYWQWPQWIVVIAWLINISANGYLHGKPRQGNYNIGATFVAIAIWAFVLYKGGFF